MIRTFFALSMSVAILVPEIVLAGGPYSGPVYDTPEIAQAHCGTVVTVKQRGVVIGYACKKGGK